MSQVDLMETMNRVMERLQAVKMLRSADEPNLDELKEALGLLGTAKREMMTHAKDMDHMINNLDMLTESNMSLVKNYYNLHRTLLNEEFLANSQFGTDLDILSVLEEILSQMNFYGYQNEASIVANHLASCYNQRAEEELQEESFHGFIFRDMVKRLVEVMKSNGDGRDIYIKGLMNTTAEAIISKNAYENDEFKLSFTYLIEILGQDLKDYRSLIGSLEMNALRAFIAHGYKSSLFFFNAWRIRGGYQFDADLKLKIHNTKMEFKKRAEELVSAKDQIVEGDR